MALAGDRLVDGVYEPIVIDGIGEGRLRGYSDALGLYVCWEDGRLRFFDPRTESYLRSHDEDAIRAEEERAGRWLLKPVPVPPRLELRSWKRSCGDCAANSPLPLPSIASRTRSSARESLKTHARKYCKSLHPAHRSVADDAP